MQAEGYARDDRPWSGSDPPGVAFVYAADRTAGRPIAHLAGFHGVLQVDGYEAYKVLAKQGDVQLAYCWSHARRAFYDLVGPIAAEALARIAGLYRIEAEIRGRSSEERRVVREERGAGLRERPARPRVVPGGGAQRHVRPAEGRRGHQAGHQHHRP